MYIHSVIQTTRPPSHAHENLVLEESVTRILSQNKLSLYTVSVLVFIAGLKNIIYVFITFILSVMFPRDIKYRDFIQFPAQTAGSIYPAAALEDTSNQVYNHQSHNFGDF